MTIRILNNMARKLNGFFLEEAPCGSTELLHSRGVLGFLPDA
jgi:hypothetical protein